MPACDGYPASAMEGVNGALRWTFCGLKPQARGLIEGRHARERRFGRHRLDWLYGEFGSEIFAARGRLACQLMLLAGNTRPRRWP